MHAVVRPAFRAFVFLVPAGLIAAAAVFAARGDRWAAAYCTVGAATPASLIPTERSLYRQSRGQGRLYGELRRAATAVVPPRERRVLRRYDSPVFYVVSRLPARLGGERVLLQRFDDTVDLPDIGDILTSPTGHGVMTSTLFCIHPWYPVVTRTADGVTVTPRGHTVSVQPSGAPGDVDAQAHRLSIRTGLGQASPDELREMIHTLTHADVVSGGPEDDPLL